MVWGSKFFPEVDFLHVGITDIAGKVNLIRDETVDFNLILEGIIKRPYGYGFSNTLHGSETSILETNLANALMLWLVVSGILGAIVVIILMLLLVIKYCIPCLKSKSNIKNMIGRSFIGLSIHSLSYGTWMTSEIILVICLMILVSQKPVENNW